MITKTDLSPDAAPLAAAFLAALPGKPQAPPPGAEGFLKAIASDYRPDELPGMSAADVAVRAAGLWAFAQVSSGAQPDIRIGPATGVDGRPLGADLVEIVQPDAPFLVDSVMAELVAAGAGILAMFHPMIETAAGRRSTIQVWIEPIGEEAAARLAAGLRATLADVRLAVGDFDAMTGLMGRSIAELQATSPGGDA